MWLSMQIAQVPVQQFFYVYISTKYNDLHYALNLATVKLEH